MGIFSSKKITYVDSVAYNMAGDYSERMNYLRTVTFGAMLNSENAYIGEGIINGLINGSYNGQRNALRWAKSNYNQAIPLTYLLGGQTINSAIATEFVESFLTSGQMASIDRSSAGYFEAEHWAERFVWQNYTPQTEYTYAIGAGNTVIVEILGGSIHIVTTPEYVPGAMYAYIDYYIEEEEEVSNFPLPGTTTIISRFGPHKHIYRYGSGSALMDTTQPSPSQLQSQFMPFAPVRIDNQFIDHSSLSSTYYEPVKKFYKKVSGGGKIDKLIDTINDNDSIADIDFAFMVFGVSLNTLSQSCKRYLYEFFDELRTNQAINRTDYDSWQLVVAQKNVILSEIENADENTDVNALISEYNSLGSIEPKYNTISQRSNWLPNFYNTEISWVFTDKEFVSAAPHTSRTIGEVWLEGLSDTTVPYDDIQFVYDENTGTTIQGVGNGTFDQKFSRCYLYKKTGINVVERIYVFGLMYRNLVYNGQWVVITGKEAFDDPEDSGFIIPINMDVLSRLPLKHRNQVCVENNYMLFNCYTIVKQKWYQRGIFKIIFAIVIAIASVIFAPAGAFGAGILGSNVAIGAAMGFGAGTLTAAIAGAVVNAIAGMIVSTIIEKVAGTLFKGKLGAILGTMLMFFGGMMASSFSAGSFNFNFADVFKPSNLLGLTQAVMKAATAWFQVDMSETMADMKKAKDDYTKQNRELLQKTRQLMGMDGQTFLDPMWFTGEPQFLDESPETFLNRTLLSASDIVELSKSMISEFAEMQIQLPEAII